MVLLKAFDFVFGVLLGWTLRTLLGVNLVQWIVGKIDGLALGLLLGAELGFVNDVDEGAVPSFLLGALLSLTLGTKLDYINDTVRQSVFFIAILSFSI